VDVDTDDRARLDHHRVHRAIHILDAFIVQWVATEKARASIIPRMDPVFIVGQVAGLVTYACNIYFIWLGERAPSPANVA
jgi:lipid-A-disaccharide synthase-like uncharacterized protein